MEHPGPEIVSVFAGIFVLFMVLVVTAVSALVYCMIFRKAGYSWALGLLMLVPIANLIMPFILAFGDWPIHREVRLLRQQQSSNPGG